MTFLYSILRWPFDSSMLQCKAVSFKAMLSVTVHAPIEQDVHFCKLAMHTHENA